MNDIIREYCGRGFTSEDIELIKWTRKKYPKLSRTELAATVCEFLGWTTPAGRAKKAQCIPFLKKLEEEGLIELPPSTRESLKGRPLKSKAVQFEIDTTKITGELKDLAPIHLEITRAGKDLPRWRRYINDYHRLGDKQVFGSRLAYFIKSEDFILGCLQFSASAWALSSRDEWIGWNAATRKQHLQLIVNNSRFLILPWVQVKNLASKALAMAIKQIQEDWLHEYCYAPVLLETFVDTSQFVGTSYKAANWIYLGETRGRGRMDPAT
jgi:hypothetical protein